MKYWKMMELRYERLLDGGFPDCPPSLRSPTSSELEEMNSPTPSGSSVYFTDSGSNASLQGSTDDHGASDLTVEKKRASDMSDKDLMDEYRTRPSQVAEWLWCLEYVAKFVKDIRCIHALMEMGFSCDGDDYGDRINEVVSLRILECLFDPSKNDVGVSEPTVAFDLSMSSHHVLSEILQGIPLSELRPGMPELSKFDLAPFIAHKNMILPQCALEKLSDMGLLKNQTNPAPSMEVNGPVSRDNPLEPEDTCEMNPIDEQKVDAALAMEANDHVLRVDQPVNMCICEERQVDEQQVHVAPSMEDNGPVSRDEPLVPMDVCEKDLIDEQKVDVAPGMEANDPVSRDNPSDPMNVCEKDPIEEHQKHIGSELKKINEKDKVIIVIDDEDDPMPTNGKDEVIVIDDDDPTDDDSNVVKGSALAKKNANTPSSSQTRPENVCRNCEKEGTLLICSRRWCEVKVHKECLDCPVNVDEHGYLYCPSCWYIRVTAACLESQKVVSTARGRLSEFFSR